MVWGPFYHIFRELEKLPFVMKSLAIGLHRLFTVPIFSLLFRVDTFLLLASATLLPNKSTLILYGSEAGILLLFGGLELLSPLLKEFHPLHLIHGTRDFFTYAFSEIDIVIPRRVCFFIDLYTSFLHLFLNYDFLLCTFLYLNVLQRIAQISTILTLT